MTFGGMPTGEKEPARWELITNCKRDRDDFHTLQLAIDGGTLMEANESLSDEVEAHGLMLRENGRPVGYAVFDTDEWEGKTIFNIEYVHVLEAARNPIVMADLVQALRRLAQERSATHVHWIAGGGKMIGISKNVPREFEKAEGIFLLPIEQFTLDAFMGRL